MKLYLILTGLLTLSVATIHAQPGNSQRSVPPHILEKFDTDGDGELSDAERAAARETMEQKRAEHIALYDTDGDGELSPEERAVARDERFEAIALERFDADGDGELSDEERAAAETARERFQDQKQLKRERKFDRRQERRDNRN